MLVRIATEKDLEILVAGNAAMALETEGLHLDLVVLRRGVLAVLAGQSPGTYRVLEVDGAIVAQLLLTYEWSDWRNAIVWWIQSVYVPPSERNKGRFREIYRAVIEDARVQGAAGVRLYVDERNQSAQAVYTALGMDGGHYRVFEQMFSELELDSVAANISSSPARVDLSGR